MERKDKLSESLTFLSYLTTKGFLKAILMINCLSKCAAIDFTLLLMRYILAMQKMKIPNCSLFLKLLYPPMIFLMGVRLHIEHFHVMLSMKYWRIPLLIQLGLNQ